MRHPDEPQSFSAILVVDDLRHDDFADGQSSQLPQRHRAQLKNPLDEHLASIVDGNMALDARGARVAGPVEDRLCSAELVGVLLGLHHDASQRADRRVDQLRQPKPRATSYSRSATAVEPADGASGNRAVAATLAGRASARGALASSFHGVASF